MSANHRGIAVIDVGATNTKVILYDPDLTEIAARRQRTLHHEGPPYLHLDAAALVDFIGHALAELDAILPVDVIATSAFGATVACCDGQGRLVLPVMDYLCATPPEVDAAYARIAPGFAETCANTSPGALTIGKQLFWLESAFPEDWARVRQIMPWSAWIAHQLGGAPASEVSNWGVFAHLWDVQAGRYSSLVRSRAWDRLFPPLRPAWEVTGTLRADLRPAGFRGHGQILTGVHDSNANWLRYLAAMEGDFTLLSSGTFVIGFSSETRIADLDPSRDVFSFTDIFGRTVACSRFYGGYEFERLLDGAPPEAADAAAVAAVLAAGTMALPAFSDTGGPVPGRAGRGRITGPFDGRPETRAAVASLYVAMMIDAQLDTLGSQAQIVIDGPFAQNAILSGLIAALRPGQSVLASALRDGTALGAALLAQIGNDGQVPRRPLPLRPVPPLRLDGLERYRNDWKAAVAADGP